VVYFGGFFPKLEFSRSFLYILFTVRISEAAMCGEHYSIFFRVPRSSFIREGEIGDGEIEEGGCE
jgi:hypothetical protein